MPFSTMLNIKQPNGFTKLNTAKQVKELNVTLDIPRDAFLSNEEIMKHKKEMIRKIKQIITMK